MAKIPPRLSAKDESDANYYLVTDLGKKIGDLKGYDYGYSLPSAGILVVSYRGVNFLLTAEPISKTDDESISEIMQRHKYRFTNKVAELDKRIEEENGNEGKS